MHTSLSGVLTVHVFRWVDDTTVLLVFPSPGMAARALSELQGEGHDVVAYADAQPKCLDQPRRDLLPPRLRPATHAGLAMRLIAHALEMPELLKHEVRKSPPFWHLFV